MAASTFLRHAATSAVAAATLVAASRALPAEGEARARRIDVVVMDRHGQPLDGLSPRDFTLRVDGAPRAILSVERRVVPRFTDEPISAIQDEVGERGAAREAGTRTFAFYLDEATVPPGLAADRVRDAASGFIDEKVHARDLTVVVRPQDVGGPFAFSRDRGLALGILDAFVGREGRMASSDETLRALVERLRSLAPDRGVLVIASGAADESLEDVARAASDAHLAVYTFDPSSTVPPKRGLAAQTGGLAFNAAGAIAGFARVAHDTEAWWTLTFDSGPDDGRFHAIDLRVRRPDAALRAPTGFWSTWPERWDSSGSTAHKAPLSGSRRALRRSGAVDIWTGISRDPNGGARVAVTWEPTALRVFHPASVSVRARRRDGQVIFEGVLGAAGHVPPATADCARFEAAPGVLEVDLSVRDATGRVIDTAALDVDVPDFAAPSPVGDLLLPVEILRSGGVTQSPAASRVFSRADRLLIRVPTVGTSVTVSAELLDRADGVIRRLDVADHSPYSFDFRLPLASLAPATYQLEVVGRESASGRTHAERVRFRIEG